jgi:hypothetical protein
VLWYDEGFACRAEVLLQGVDARSSPRRIVDLVLARLQAAGIKLDHCDWQTPGHLPNDSCDAEGSAVVLRLTAADRRRAAIEQFAAEIASLRAVASLGVVSLTHEPPRVEPRLRRWPTVVPRELVEPAVEVRAAADWI